MFSVIYTFKVKPGKETELIEGWTNLTKLIYSHEGSLGSRLHKTMKGDFVAYAQWPDKDTWKNAGSNLPPEADRFRQMMKASCESILTEYEMEVVTDLIKIKPKD